MKNKKLKWILLSLCMVLSGCNLDTEPAAQEKEEIKVEIETEARTETERETEAVIVPGSTETEQLVLLAENKDLWAIDPDYISEVCQYAVTDLDHNGRLEIIVSDFGGTGQYTFSRFFEVNRTFDGVEECSTDFAEGDSQPDLMYMNWKTFRDENGKDHYVLYDQLKISATEYYESIRDLVLEDGKISAGLIANKMTVYSPEGESAECQDEDGNVISVQEYEDAAEVYFAGYQQDVAILGWQDMRELDADREMMMLQLQESWMVWIQE